MADDLKKGLTGMVAAAGLALASGGAPTAAPKAPVEVALGHTPKPWTPEGLDPEMHPIAHLESSWGKNMKHAEHPGGVFQTAYGAVGLKPQTGHEEYLRSKDLQKEYPNLTKPEDFTAHLQQDHVFYNKVASKHWQHLRSKLGSPIAASYGWRWGIGAAKRTSGQIQKEDPYVQKFSEMSHQSLGKMSINDVTPGQKKKQFVWDYSHLLTPENKMAGYQVMVSFHPASQHPKFGRLRDRFHGEILQHGKPVGNLSAALHSDCLGGPCIEPHITIQEGHHQRGLGTALYEGVFKEAKMAGIKSIHGYEHSAGSHALHSKLAQRHGMGYKPADSDGDHEYPYGEYKYLIKAEELIKDDREHAGTIRKLLAGDNASDWYTALRIPSANQEDMDFLLDRFATLPKEGMPANQRVFEAGTWLGGQAARKVLAGLQATRFWDTNAMHRVMDMPVFRKPSNTGFFAQNGAATGSTITRLLDDVDDWAPKLDYMGDSYGDDGKPSGYTANTHRPALESILGASELLSPEHIDKYLGLVHSENLVGEGVPSDFFDNHDSIHPDFISKWMDFASKANDRYTMGHLGKFISNDALFDKVLKLDPDLGGPALHKYATSGKMSDKHFQHLLSHPSSLAESNKTNKLSEVQSRAQDIREAIHLHLQNAQHISQETADAVVKHPNKAFVAGLAQMEGLAPETYRAMYKMDPEFGQHFVNKAGVPEDVRTDIVKKMLDDGDEGDIPYSLREGKILGRDEDGNEAYEPMSKEMVDLAVNHPNPAMVKAAVVSPHLTNEHALTLINKGQGEHVIGGMGSKGYNGVEDHVDKATVAKAITDRPNDVRARQAMVFDNSFAPHLGKEFFDSVANNELAQTGPGMGYQNQLVTHLLDPKFNVPADFLQKAIKAPAVSNAALYHPNLPTETFDAALPQVLNTSPQGLETFLNMARQPESHIQQKHLEYAKQFMEAKVKDPKADHIGSYQFRKLYQGRGWTPERLGQMWKDENMFYNPSYDHPEEIRESFLEHPNRPDSIMEDYMTHPDIGVPHVDKEIDEERQNHLTNGSHSKAALKRWADHFEKNGGDLALPGIKSLLAKQAREKAAVYEPDSVYRKPLGEVVPAHAMLTGTPHFVGELVRDVGDPQGHIQVRPGNQKLRKIRDLIMQKAPEKGEIKPKDLPPGDWSAGRLPNGNISAKKLNEHIDSQEPHGYNFSHTNWQGAQRHNAGRYGLDETTGKREQGPQKVFQVNLTNDQFDKLDEAGVGDTFRKMVKLSQTSSHPVRMNHTLGWVRYDGDKDNGFHIDEIQSDFGQSFVRQAAQQADAEGLDATEAARRAEAEYPEEHYAKIKHILFKDRHPNEMVAEAFHQYLRDQGHHNTPVHILHSETKAPISGQKVPDPEKLCKCKKFKGDKGDVQCKVCGGDKPLPAHMQHTYKEVPKKLGMEPKSYGAIPAQNNEAHKGKPTWGGKVHKFEQQAAAWGKALGIESLAKSVEEGDFKSIARAVDPTGGSTVDYRPDLEAHPSSATDQVNNYRENVLQSPTRNKRLSSKGLDGITAKTIYKTSAPDGTEQKYLVKPYHERVIRRTKDWQKHAIQGWSEMTNQSLYTAAGIGHLHQTVHTSEHPMRIDGESKMEPALVVHLAPGFKPVVDHKFDREHDADLHDSTMKIGLMDFLTNNVDRHGLNLLVNPETRKMLAIDHSRSFQYKANSKPFYRWDRQTQEEKLHKPKEGEDDSLGNYILGSAISKVMPPSHSYTGPNNHNEYLDKWADVVENWWPKVSQSLRKELDGRLEQIKNPTLKEHIRKNFHARADLLDEQANIGLSNYGQDDWHSTPVEMTPYKS